MFFTNNYAKKFNPERAFWESVAARGNYMNYIHFIFESTYVVSDSGQTWYLCLFNLLDTVSMTFSVQKVQMFVREGLLNFV